MWDSEDEKEIVVRTLIAAEREIVEPADKQECRYRTENGKNLENIWDQYVG